MTVVIRPKRISSGRPIPLGRAHPTHRAGIGVSDNRRRHVHRRKLHHRPTSIRDLATSGLPFPLRPRCGERTRSVRSRLPQGHQMSTVLAQLYQLTFRSFLALRLRCQHLLRDHVAAQLADARDHLLVSPADPKGQRRRSARPSRGSLPRPARPTRRPRRGRGRGEARSESPSQSPSQPSCSTSGSDCSMSTCSLTTPSLEVEAHDVVDRARDSQVLPLDPSP